MTTSLGRPALVAAPLLVLAAHLTQSSPSAHDTASELASIAAATGRYQAAGVLGFLACLLFVPALLTLGADLRVTRPRWAAAGTGLSITGLLALVSLQGSGPVSQALAESPGRAAAIAVTDAYEGLPLPTAWVLLMLVGWVLGPVVLGVGLWRSGATPLVPVLLAGGVVVQMADAGRWPLAAGFLLTAAGFGLCATPIGRPASRTVASPEPVPALS
ncbi:hypothetical protein [Nocardioides marmoribigeumensis]|uniref:DUF4386 family protein n=1 Tax=Nocardioides marmoribigeumensis TaxID=433649 RepID=A0ABU2BVB8_9ACTN|nr:hypothetical protein [Nocardioides marmoribigeumensis]MDR7362585.1 hypothetical protein [Nocardioides marmoribigeumensis]